MEILIPITLFAMIAGIVISTRYFRSIERQKLTDTLRAAIDKGQPLPPEVIEAMSTDARVKAPSAEGDLRTGIIWTGIGVGMVGLSLGVGLDGSDEAYKLLGVAAFPVFIGLAFILISVLAKKRA